MPLTHYKEHTHSFYLDGYKYLSNQIKDKGKITPRWECWCVYSIVLEEGGGSLIRFKSLIKVAMSMFEHLA
jgi:hypothetical protein